MLSKSEPTNLPPLQYKEHESPSNRIGEVSNNVDEHDQLQIIVDTFTCDGASKWDTHQSCM